MPRNGAGSFSLAEPAFVPNTPISSSAMNSDLSDIASALTTSIASDGQTTITGALKGASGSVGSPSYSFAADLDTGLYRIGANNLGIAVGGTKIVDISATGVSITGTWSPSGQILAADGTVSLPGISFASDPDSGFYRIGANNLGIGVNGAKVLDIGTSGLNVVGTVSSNGAVIAPASQAGVMINGKIVESRAGNAATFALKTIAGTDPSATDIVYVIFRNVTAGTGDYAVLQITAALSLVLSSGSTLGFTSATAGRLWLVIFNDGGTPRIGAINCRSGINTYPLGAWEIASSTAEGGAGAADSALVFYTGTAVAAKAYTTIAYATYETGLTTAGNWDAAPTRIQPFDPSVPLPGRMIQVRRNFTGAVATGATVIPYDDTIPQNTEGDQFLTQAITPTSAANLLEIEAQLELTIATASDRLAMALFQDSTANALAAVQGMNPGNGLQVNEILNWAMLAGTSSSTTFNVRAGGSTGNTVTVNGEAAARKYGGVLASRISVTEIMG